eukprot:c4408_g1_i1.p1 GENE.c4408_g1_i1~~c4408_g1_i1.p1  ORF type:complete len:197 (-),score=73.86 c4408_g1_i1:46-636(-)
MAAGMIAKFFPPLAGLCYGENYLTKNYLSGTKAGESVSLQVPRLYGLVLAVNVIGGSFVLVALGTKVGMARRKYLEAAKKKGDADAEARFSYPKLYAEGFSEEAKLFNCVQRGHQQALETYPSFLACSLVGGLTQPLMTSFGGLLWCIARLRWAKGYATGEPNNRYADFWAPHIWTALLIQFVTCGCTAVHLLRSK